MLPSLVVTAIVLSSNPVTPAAAPSDVVARIGTYELPRSLFDAMWRSLPEGARASYNEAGGQSAFLADYLNQKVLAVRAANLGLDQTDALKAALENATMAILGRALVEDEVTSKVVTEAAMRQYYDDHQEGFKIPEQLRLRHIVVTPHRERELSNTTGDDASNDAEAKAKIERLATELSKGADFADLARQWSEDRTATDGGLITSVSRGRMARAIEDAAFALEPGKTSGVIATPYGYHLVRLEERTKAVLPSYEEVKERVRMAVAQERQAEFQPALDALRKRLNEQMGVEVLDPTLRLTASAAEPAKSSKP